MTNKTVALSIALASVLALVPLRRADAQVVVSEISTWPNFPQPWYVIHVDWRNTQTGPDTIDWYVFSHEPPREGVFITADGSGGTFSNHSDQHWGPFNIPADVCAALSGTLQGASVTTPGKTASLDCSKMIVDSGEDPVTSSAVSTEEMYAFWKRISKEYRRGRDGSDLSNYVGNHAQASMSAILRLMGEGVPVMENIRANMGVDRYTYYHVIVDGFGKHLGDANAPFVRYLRFVDRLPEFEKQEVERQEALLNDVSDFFIGKMLGPGYSVIKVLNAANKRGLLHNKTIDLIRDQTGSYLVGKVHVGQVPGDWFLSMATNLDKHWETIWGGKMPYGNDWIQVNSHIAAAAEEVEQAFIDAAAQVELQNWALAYIAKIREDYPHVPEDGWGIEMPTLGLNEEDLKRLDIAAALVGKGRYLLNRPALVHQAQLVEEAKARLGAAMGNFERHVWLAGYDLNVGENETQPPKIDLSDIR